MKNTTAITAIAASTLAGLGAGAIMFVPGLAGADDQLDMTAGDSSDHFGIGDDVDHVARLTEALQPLVDDGTLTEAQRDAVVTTLDAARPEKGSHGRGLGGEAVAEALGLTTDELRDAVMNGSTLADVAADQGVAVDDVVSAIVAQAEARLTTAVDSGRIDQATADEMLTEAQTRAEAMVDGEFTPRGPGRGHRGHGPGHQHSDDTESAAIDGAA